jgi:truncated hemoglobin YjbI
LPDNDPRYFIDIYTNYTGPSFNSIKVLKDFAVTLDDIGISDTATFAETKVLSDTRNQQRDKATFAPVKALKELQYQTDHIGPFSTVKVLKDFARTLDEIGISDKATFTDNKVIADALNPQPDKTKFQTIKALKDFARTLDEIGIDDKANYIDLKVIHDFQRTKEGPQDYNFDNYVPGYTDPTYISDGQVVISKLKELKDFAVTLDDIGISDTATFTDVKPFSDPRNQQLDKAAKQPTKSVRDISVYEMDHIGPFTVTKALKDFARTLDEIGISDKATFVDAKLLVDTNIQRDKTAIQLSRTFRDWTGTLDEIGINDKSTFVDTKVVRDYQPQGFEGPAYRKDSNLYATGYFVDDVLYYGPTFNTNKALKEYAPSAEGPTYNNQDIFANAIGLPDNDPRYFIDLYTLYTGPTVVYSKLLKDFAVTFDDLGVSDTSTFTDTKPFSEPRNYQVDKSINIYYKAVKDFARTIDDIGISDKATFTDVKPLRELFAVPFDKPAKSFSRKVTDFARTLDDIGVSDTSTFTDTKPFKEAINPQIDRSVKTYSKSIKDFVYQYDRLARYKPLFPDAPIQPEKPFDKAAVSFSRKVTDFAKTLDEIGIDDKANYVDLKVIKDFQRTKEGPSYYNFNNYVPGYTDPTYIDDGQVVINKIKSLKDYQVQLEGPAYDNQDLYAKATGLPDGDSRYFIDPYTFYSGPVFNTNKKLKDFSTQFNTGLVSNWNYTTTVGNAVFFNEDFVGVSYIIN